MDLTKISTERRNENSRNIDKSSTFEILQIINREDFLVAQAINSKLKDIAEVVDLIYKKFKIGGRLIYIGAGSSGRLGVLDASEMLATYGIHSDRIFGIIAGGEVALKLSQESVEDNQALAIKDLKSVNFNSSDILIAISASGRTPYVLSALKYCQEVDGLGIGLTMATSPKLISYAKKVIVIETGQEVITGSTRMKAGTATKMVLNMISTALMIKCGKVYQNLMVDLVANNEKLKVRVRNIVAEITKIEHEKILKVLVASNYQCKNAIVMLIKNVDYQTSVNLLEQHDGFLAYILE